MFRRGSAGRSGPASAWGSRGRRFESCRPDQRGPLTLMPYIPSSAGPALPSEDHYWRSFVAPKSRSNGLIWSEHGATATKSRCRRVKGVALEGPPGWQHARTPPNVVQPMPMGRLGPLASGELRPTDRYGAPTLLNGREREHDVAGSCPRQGTQNMGTRISGRGDYDQRAVGARAAQVDQTGGRPPWTTGTARRWQS